VNKKKEGIGSLLTGTEVYLAECNKKSFQVLILKGRRQGGFRKSWFRPIGNETSELQHIKPKISYHKLITNHTQLIDPGACHVVCSIDGSSGSG
jgi:hypothetical protein